MAGRKRIYDFEKLKSGKRVEVFEENVKKYKHQYANYYNKTSKIKVKAVTEGERVFFEAINGKGR